MFRLYKFRRDTYKEIWPVKIIGIKEYRSNGLVLVYSYGCYCYWWCEPERDLQKMGWRDNVRWLIRCWRRDRQSGTRLRDRRDIQKTIQA